MCVLMPAYLFCVMAMGDNYLRCAASLGPIPLAGYCMPMPYPWQTGCTLDGAVGTPLSMYCHVHQTPPPGLSPHILYVGAVPVAAAVVPLLAMLALLALRVWPVWQRTTPEAPHPVWPFSGTAAVPGPFFAMASVTGAPADVTADVPVFEVPPARRRPGANPPERPHVQSHSLEDLFPGTGLADAWDESLELGKAVRKAMRDVLYTPDPNRSEKVNRAIRSLGTPPPPPPMVDMHIHTSEDHDEPRQWNILAQ